MNQRSLDIRSSRRAHYEAAIGCLVEPNATIRFVHVGSDLIGVEQNDQMLGEEPESIHYQVLFSQPNGAAFRNAELRAHHSDVYIGQFVRIANAFDPSSTSDLWHGR